jgi:hypothetical protein
LEPIHVAPGQIPFRILAGDAIEVARVGFELVEFDFVDRFDRFRFGTISGFRVAVASAVEVNP